MLIGIFVGWARSNWLKGVLCMCVSIAVLLALRPVMDRRPVRWLYLNPAIVPRIYSFFSCPLPRKGSMLRMFNCNALQEVSRRLTKKKLIIG